MLSDEVIEKVTERLVRRMEQANEYILQQIGESINKIGTLTPSKAQQLAQILRYGGDYDKIVKKIAELTELNVQDIYKLFEEVAKSDYQFAKQFYKYRNKKYIPWKQNKQLRDQVKVLATITANQYINMARSSMIGFGLQDDKGNLIFKGLEETYNYLLDQAILNVGSGKQSFDDAMYKVLKDIGSGGLKVIYPTVYPTLDQKGNMIIKNRTMRIDSATRMHISDAVRSLHNEMQATFGKQFGSDGVEISVHEYPAPDHELVQGRQFSKKQFDRFQNDEDAVSYDGMKFPKISEETGQDRRAISQYNCYHYTFDIVLGVSEPRYSEEQLNEIIKQNNDGFIFEKRKYTYYQGTQLQRRLELEIRKAKDQQILGRASNNEKLINKSQERIELLISKYKKLSRISKLPEKVERMRVLDYHHIKTS